MSVHVGDLYVAVVQFDVLDLTSLPIERRGPSDPSSVVLVVTSPSGIVTTYTYPATLDKVRDGTYYASINVTEPGEWALRWAATGSAQGAGRSRFHAIA